MVPKVAGKGRSFKGAALYYLHDKGALTSHRVAFSHTENLPTRDADNAFKCMAWTAMHQQEIKARAGGSAKGRKLAFPVYCYSLSWAPDEKPTPEEMIWAARETLQVLGLDGHESLFVSHNDEPHPHIHVIVNRVHPVTGIAAPLSNDHLKLSAWAEAYEKAQGQIRCEQRVENNARRREKEFVKDRESQHAAEFHRWRKLRLQGVFHKQSDEQKSLSSIHTKQRQALFKQKEKRIAEKCEEIRDRHREHWRLTYQDQEKAREKLRIAERTRWRRLKYYLHTAAREYFRAEKEQRTGFLSSAFDAVIGGPKLRADLDKKQRAQRMKLSLRIDAQRKSAFREINNDFRAVLAKLKVQQSKEQQEAIRREVIRKPPSEERVKQSKKKLKEIAENKLDISHPRKKYSKDFNKTQTTDAQATRERLKQKMSERRYNEIREQANDVTIKKEPVKKSREEETKKNYRAFRELADEVTRKREKGGGRSFERKPPKAPEFR